MPPSEDTIRLELDLGQSTAKTIEFSKALSTVAVTADQAAVPALKHLDAAADEAVHSTARVGRGMLEASYAVQDFTSQLGDRGLSGALNAIQNNIPGMLMGFGVTGGITAGISVLSVGAGLLYQNWDKLHALWSSGQTGEEAARMKELAEETEKATKAAEKQLQGMSAEQAAGGGNLGKAIKQFGGPKVRDAMKQALIRYQGDFGDDANQSFVTNLVANVNRGDPAALAMMRDMFGGQGDDLSRALTGRPTGREARAQQGDWFEKLRADANAKFEKDQAQRRQRMERNLDQRTERDIAEETRAAADEARKAARVKQGFEQAPAAINRARDVLERGRELMQRQQVEREINRRGGGRDSTKDIQEAARRTLDLTARGVNINQAILVAMREQGAKIQALENLINGQEQQVRQIRQQGRNRQPAGMRRAFPG